MLRSILIISLAVLQLTVAQCTVPPVCSGFKLTSSLLDKIIKESGVSSAVQVDTTGFNPVFTSFPDSVALIISDEPKISGTVANQKRYYAREFELTCLPKNAFVYCKSSSPGSIKLYANGVYVPGSPSLCAKGSDNKPVFANATHLINAALKLTRHFFVGKNIIEWEVINGNGGDKNTNPIGLIYEIVFT